MRKKLYVVSGPSGAGISDIVAAIFAKRADVSAVTPITARKMKKGETDGVGFFFYDLDGWKALKDSGGMLECTEFAGNDYGTSRALVEEKLNAGQNVLLNLEVERAAQVKANMPEAVCVYIEPSPAVLRARYEAIARSPFELSVRLESSDKQRALSAFADARIVSDDLTQAIAELDAIIQ